MESGITLKRFSQVFKGNIHKRSRTASGTSDVSSTPGKKKLLLDGNDLASQVERNTDNLIKLIWHDFEDCSAPLSPENIRSRMEHWYDVINHNLQDADAYADEREKYIVRAQHLKVATRRNYRINNRYRLATPKYLIEKGVAVYPIVELEFQMDYFYQDLSDLLKNRKMTLPQLLAFADMQIDGKIHPWVDGCGRVATALVMWLALWCDQVLPIFGNRDEHYSAIKANDEEAHVNYYNRCLNRQA